MPADDIPLSTQDFERVAAQAAENAKRDAKVRQGRRQREENKKKRQKTKQDQPKSDRHPTHTVTCQHDDHRQDGYYWLKPLPQQQTQGDAASKATRSKGRPTWAMMRYPMRWLAWVARWCITVAWHLLGHGWVIAGLVCFWLLALLIEATMRGLLDSLQVPLLSAGLGWLWSLNVPWPGRAVADLAAVGPVVMRTGEPKAVEPFVHLDDMMSNILHLAQVQVEPCSDRDLVARFVGQSFSRHWSAYSGEPIGGPSGDLGKEWKRLWKETGAKVEAISNQCTLYQLKIIDLEVLLYRRGQGLIRQIQTHPAVPRGDDEAPGSSWLRPKGWPMSLTRRLARLCGRRWKAMRTAMGFHSASQHTLRTRLEVFKDVIEGGTTVSVHLTEMFGSQTEARRDLEKGMCRVERIFREAGEACDWTLVPRRGGGGGGLDVVFDEARKAHDDAGAGLLNVDGGMRVSTFELEEAALELTGYQSAGAVLCMGGKKTVEAVEMKLRETYEWMAELDLRRKRADIMMKAVESVVSDKEVERLEQELLGHVEEYVRRIGVR
ncbi:hypothetical protein ColLi_13270 [Colletotrichum liriopes]|uniref:Uncharacterized protein n=1 Tax=Colletotrichum liriopes TaxID=708192 RepID=A0AA37LZD1_9PEZI|nr:hypothetical protein ColLi_13270 [Colletotrichum liriopes]